MRKQVWCHTYFREERTAFHRFPMVDNQSTARYRHSAELLKYIVTWDMNAAIILDGYIAFLYSEITFPVSPRLCF